ncbi:cis-aconitate decarboxylase [Gadus morhua]|uniref:Aconitate decarboxylase 1 n=1 Tax=Gadus morhua TaxID=8049 RepID=A0A8C5CRX0_GADMO|nr:cis-aconitate decarboxylase [Gadus morhua]
MLRKNVTRSFGAAISGLGRGHLTERVISRSKRMMLDTLGVGLIGTQTEVYNKALRYSQSFTSRDQSQVWGRAETALPPQYAAFVNGVAVHSMDFDDTWHPATHPSGAILPAVLALAEVLPRKLTGLDLILAFNIGIEVQGRLLSFSREALNIPQRFHPPTVVGVMGSAAASANLLGLSPAQCTHALAIASSFAGSPLANAATPTKPLHMGNAAGRGLEAAWLAWMGLEGNPDVLDLESGFGVFFNEYNPSALADVGGFEWALESQSVAVKSFPAHLGMHWVAEAALAAKAELRSGGESSNNTNHLDQVRSVTLRVPASKYINRTCPSSEHQARHSFQFNACSALLDDRVTVESFSDAQRNRPALRELLSKVRVESPEDNHPSFDKMYCEVVIETHLGNRYAGRCDTFYGHWRRPLSQEDLERKFRDNASTVLSSEGVEGILEVVGNMERITDSSALGLYLQMTSNQ